MSKKNTTFHFPWISEISFNKKGLVPVVVQDFCNNKMLMLAWMNKEAIFKTVTTGVAIYWSRSRKALWKKGEKSGHTQFVKELYIDCDNDSLLLRVNQYGGIACHTGRYSCFFRRLGTDEDQNRKTWIQCEAVLREPKLIYK